MKLTALARWNLDACQRNLADSGRCEHQDLDFLVVMSSLRFTALSASLYNPVESEEFKLETGNGWQPQALGQKLRRESLACHSTDAVRSRLSTAHPARPPGVAGASGLDLEDKGCRPSGQPPKARGESGRQRLNKKGGHPPA
jgi:hypothetical protein